MSGLVTSAGCSHLLRRSWGPLEVWRRFVFCPCFVVSLETWAVPTPHARGWLGASGWFDRVRRYTEGSPDVRKWRLQSRLALPRELAPVLLSGFRESRGGDEDRWLLAQVSMEPAWGSCPRPRLRPLSGVLRLVATWPWEQGPWATEFMLRRLPVTPRLQPTTPPVFTAVTVVSREGGRHERLSWRLFLAIAKLGEKKG